MEPGPEKLGRLLRERRQELGLTLENVEAATRKTGTRVSTQFLSDTERAYVREGGSVTTPSDAKLRALSRVLDIPLVDLHAALGRGTAQEEHPALAYLRRQPDAAKDRALRILEAALPSSETADAPVSGRPAQEHSQAHSALVTRAEGLSRELRAARPRLSRAPAVVWALDRQGRFLMSEGGGLSDLSLRPGQVVGLRIWDVYKDAPDFLEKVRLVLASDGPLEWGAEVRGCKYLCKTEPLLGAGGEKIGIVGTSLAAADAQDRRQGKAA